VEQLKIPVVWKYYLFWLLRGLKPQFTGLDYIQIKEVYNITDLEYGEISLYASISMMLGIPLYSRYFKHFEMRNLYYFVVFFKLVAATVDLWQAKRMNLQYGISDFLIVSLNSSVYEAFFFAIFDLPSMVMIQKVTAKHVEATMLALAFSLCNISNGLLPKFTGFLVNDNITQVTKEDMGDYWKLKIVLIVSCAYELCLIRLIPWSSEVKKVVKISAE
jgi:hypothetical protein